MMKNSFVSSNNFPPENSFYIKNTFQRPKYVKKLISVKPAQRISLSPNRFIFRPKITNPNPIMQFHQNSNYLRIFRPQSINNFPIYSNCSFLPKPQIISTRILRKLPSSESQFFDKLNKEVEEFIGKNDISVQNVDSLKNYILLKNLEKMEKNQELSEELKTLLKKLRHDMFLYFFFLKLLFFFFRNLDGKSGEESIINLLIIFYILRYFKCFILFYFKLNLGMNSKKKKLLDILKGNCDGGLSSSDLRSSYGKYLLSLYEKENGGIKDGETLDEGEEYYFGSNGHKKERAKKSALKSKNFNQTNTTETGGFSVGKSNENFFSQGIINESSNKNDEENEETEEEKKRKLDLINEQIEEEKRRELELINEQIFIRQKNEMIELKKKQLLEKYFYFELELNDWEKKNSVNKVKDVQFLSKKRKQMIKEFKEQIVKFLNSLTKTGESQFHSKEFILEIEVLSFKFI